MASVVSTAVAAMVAALQAAPAVAPQVERVRLRPVGAAATTAVVVRPLQADVLGTDLSPGQPIAWEARIAVECYARAAAGTAPDVAVDPVLTAAYARLMADPTLAGAVLLLQPLGVSFDFDADGEQTACAVAVFQVRLRGAPSTLIA